MSRVACDPTHSGFGPAVPFGREGCPGTLRFSVSLHLISVLCHRLWGQAPCIWVHLLLPSVQCGWWQLLLPRAPAKTQCAGGFGRWKPARGRKMSRLTFTIKLSARCAGVFKYWYKHRRNSCFLPEEVRVVWCKTSLSSLPAPCRSQLSLPGTTHENCGDGKSSSPACTDPESWNPSKTILGVAQIHGWKGFPAPEEKSPV